MTTTTLTDTPVERDAEGFFVHPEQWTETMADEIARENGIDNLTDRHWQVINFMRRTYLETRQRAVDPHARQGLGRPDQGAIPAVPQGAGQARRQDRRHPQATRLHLADSRRQRKRGHHDRSTRTPTARSPQPQTIEKVSIIISKGSLEGIYPGLIMANGARMEGIDANLFFTFFGLDAINKAKHDHVKVATVGNPGLHLATWAGGFPGVSSMVTHKFATEMEKLDIPPIPEFIEMIADSGAGLYACKASVDMFHLTKDDFIPQVQDIITVGEFYGLAAGGQIIFT